LIPERDREFVGLRRKIFNFHRTANSIAGQLDSVQPELEDANAASARIIATFKHDDLLAWMAKQDVLSMQRIEEKRKKQIPLEQGRLLKAFDAMHFLTQPSTATKPRVITAILKVKSKRKNSSTRKAIDIGLPISQNNYELLLRINPALLVNELRK
jgi:hypothetical protein